MVFSIVRQDFRNEVVVAIYVQEVEEIVTEVLMPKKGKENVYLVMSLTSSIM